ncbi:hypothetical protein GPL21_33415 [Bradyrhizobium pachyrhizi]|uniref:Tail fiber protein n=1 Tax=Bradyrhizobium pachyrhizi TaxID=280333 RepID=A0A844SX83_9BRAD|nr:hypothetical protein [Bradyrhizobium pachyrhizi]MVT69985.1 hypothetical protein [Bradyrhizobium pachyrhizi]
MPIDVLDANGQPQTIATVADLIAIVGQVNASPDANTVQDRLKTLAAKLDTIHGDLATTLAGYVDGLETLVGTTNSNGSTTNTKLTSILAALSPVATASGMTDSRIMSAATTNATLLKNSAGNVYEIDVFNNAAYAVYLKLYNKASAPTVGTDTPKRTITIPAGGGYSRKFDTGYDFATGISYAITKAVADGDTTAVAANDLVGGIRWL